jgi:hypothetical protein
MTEDEKKAIWDDWEKLNKSIGLLIIQLNLIIELIEHWGNEKTKAKKSIEQADTEIKILEEEYKQLDVESIELIKRCRELEKQALSKSSRDNDG